MMAQLDIYEFGKQLLETGDLDPVYLMLEEANLDEAQLYRWLIAYWCYYDCGVASYLSELKAEYWTVFLAAAENIVSCPGTADGRWPRGSERRHFRGAQAINAVHELCARYPLPEKMLEYIIGDGTPQKFQEVAARAKIHRGFGSWISFKIGDMLDRLGLVKVDFTRSDVFFFDDPAKAAEIFFRKKNKVPDACTVKRDVVIPEVVSHLEDHFKNYMAPPIYERPVGIQEIETILCKWKSHLNGHYPVQKDTKEILHKLERWEIISPTAKIVRHALGAKCRVL